MDRKEVLSSVKHITVSLHNTQYEGGGTLMGDVLLELLKPLQMRLLFIRVTGIGRVVLEVKKIGRRNTVISDREVYLHKDINVHGSRRDLFTHPPGVHVYNFSCELAQELPSSFQGDRGNIEYSAVAEVVTPSGEIVQSSPFIFTVCSRLDPDILSPNLRRPVTCLKRKHFLTFPSLSSDIILDGILPRSYYTPGEHVGIIGCLRNRRMSVNIFLKFVQLVTYTSFHKKAFSRSEWDEGYTSGHEALQGKCSPQKYRKSPVNILRERVISEVCSEQHLPADSSYNLSSLTVRIPSDLIPSSHIGSPNVISVSYKVCLECSNAKNVFIFRAQYPVVLGTVPLRKAHFLASTSRLLEDCSLSAVSRDSDSDFNGTLDSTGDYEVGESDVEGHGHSRWVKSRSSRVLNSKYGPLGPAYHSPASTRHAQDCRRLLSLEDCVPMDHFGRNMRMVSKSTLEKDSCSPPILFG